MTKMRPQKSTGVRQSRAASRVSEQNNDVCELLVAELQARRVRLQELLALVWQEVERTPPAPVAPARTHSRRQPNSMKAMAMKQTA